MARCRALFLKICIPAGAISSSAEAILRRPGDGYAGGDIGRKRTLPNVRTCLARQIFMHSAHYRNAVLVRRTAGFGQSPRCRLRLRSGAKLTFRRDSADHILVCSRSGRRQRELQFEWKRSPSPQSAFRWESCLIESSRWRCYLPLYPILVQSILIRTIPSWSMSGTKPLPPIQVHNQHSACG